MSETYTKNQKKIALTMYISIVIACIVSIAGIVYTIADLIMATGKLTFFLSLNVGYQIAIVGALLAGLFFLIVNFYGLYRKGVNLILKNIFKKKYYDEKYKNRVAVKVAAGALMLSVCAIVIGIVFALFYELFSAPGGSQSTIISLFAEFSDGQIVLFIGIMLFIIIGLIFFLNYLWYNGYYMILKLVEDLEVSE